MNNEPVAWMSSQTDEDGDTLTMFSTYHDPLNTKQIPLYTNPVKELTDKEIRECIHQIDPNKTDMFMSFARAILRKASEK